MIRRKPTMRVLVAAVMMAGLSFTPLAVPAANAQIDVHFSWETPPHEYSPAQREGFHAGIEAARRDMRHGLPPDVRRHAEFRHPHMHRDRRDEFRRGFEHGYEMAYSHRGDMGYRH